MIGQTRAGSWYTGSLPGGCKLCLKGAKLVVFVTGKCGFNCFYCPISFRRGGRDVPYANERPVAKKSDLLLEGRRMAALGAGVTGGEPLLRVGKTVNFVKLLKSNFGEKFHIHLYTSGRGATEKTLSRLYDAGVDEVRFHWARGAVKTSLGFGWDVGAEIPALPGNFAETKNYLDFLDGVGAKFCNINELDFSERNLNAFKKRGYKLKHKYSCAVAGSEELAKKLLEYADERLSVGVHYCPSFIKDAVQSRKRFIRTARNIRRPFERVDGDGLLVKGVICPPTLYEKLVSRFPKKMLVLDREKNRIETSVDIARKLRKEFICKIVRETPTYDQVEMEVTPL